MSIRTSAVVNRAGPVFLFKALRVYLNTEDMQKKAKKVLVLTVGIIFIILGFFGLVLPFLQGFLFLAIGLFLLSFYFPKTRLWIEKHTEKYPRLFLMTKKVEKWMTKIIGEV